MTTPLVSFRLGFALALALALVAGCGTDNAAAPRKVYVGLFGDNAVGVVDTTTGVTLATIPVAGPDGLVITPDGSKVYVSSTSAGVVDVIDTATDKVSTSITVGATPAGLSISHDGAHVVAAVGGDNLAAIIATASDTVVATAPVGKAHSSGISADGTLAFVSSQTTGAPAIVEIQLPSGTVNASYPTDGTPRALCDVGGKLYVSLANNNAVEALDAATGQLGAQIATGGTPHDVRPTLDGTQILTVAQAAGELDFIDPATASPLAHVATGKMPHWIALSSDGKLAYVTNELDNNLVVVDLAAHKVTQTFAVGQAPRKIAVQP